MMKAMKSRRHLRSTIITGVSAVAIAGILTGIYFENMPNTEAVEFVKPVEEPIDESLLDEGFNPLTELGLGLGAVHGRPDQRYRQDYRGDEKRRAYDGQHPALKPEIPLLQDDPGAGFAVHHGFVLLFSIKSGECALISPAFFSFCGQAIDIIPHNMPIRKASARLYNLFTQNGPICGIIGRAAPGAAREGEA